MKHSIRFDSDAPDGWSSVETADVIEGRVSAILVRDGDRESRPAPSITITEQLVQPEVDLKEFALQYAERKRTSTIGLEVTRSEYITEDEPVEYGQEMQFILVSGIAVKLAHMTIATPTATGETHVLEIVFSAPNEQYLSCSDAFGAFLKSIRVVTDRHA